MYRYDEFDQDARRRARRAVPRPDAALPRRRADRGRVPAAAAAKRPLHPEARADAARRDSVRTAVVARSCARSPTSPASMTEDTATSPPARTSSSTGRASRTCRRSSALLATVEMHAIQTSGNCVRNMTSDPLAGVAGDEIVDPAPVVRADPAVVDAPSGIRVPAAQVQDRGHRRDGRPRRDPGPRHRRAGRARRRRRGRASGWPSAAARAARR